MAADVLTLRPAAECRFDAVALEAMLRFYPGEA